MAVFVVYLPHNVSWTKISNRAGQATIPEEKDKRDVTDGLLTSERNGSVSCRKWVGWCRAIRPFSGPISFQHGSTFNAG